MECGRLIQVWTAICGQKESLLFSVSVFFVNCYLNVVLGFCGSVILGAVLSGTVGPGGVNPNPGAVGPAPHLD